MQIRDALHSMTFAHTIQRTLYALACFTGAFLILFFALFVAFAAHTFAADILMSPSLGTYTKGQSFTVSVRLDPKGKSVNAVESTLTFDTSKLSVVSVSKTGSIFSLWTTEPTFSNTLGTVQFGGGSPTPFSTASQLVSITFQANAEGTAAVDFKKASVLAADGLGTDVYGASVKGSYTIGGATTPTPTPETPTTPKTEPAQTLDTNDEEETSDTIAFGDPPRAPDVGSKVFLDQDTWYATSSGLFTWELPFDVTEMAMDMSTSSEFIPVTIIKPPVSEKLLTELELFDGVQYFTIQYRNQVGWGAIAHRKILVDTEPPAPFTIDVRAGNSTSSFPTLSFDAKDYTSGIDRYDLTIANREPVIVTPDEARLGYLITALEDGTYTVRVTAFDKAGNKIESTTPILITSGWKPASLEEKASIAWALFTASNITISLLFLLIIALIGYIIYERKLFGRMETRLRKETKEIQDQTEKIFSALRDEIYEQINSITRKPRLSRQEKSAIEGLNSALEVSETLIEKEIVDVQKILK